MKKTALLTIAAVLVLVLAFILLSGYGKPQESPREYYKDKVAVLMYHHIDQEESGATITPGRFEEHLDTLLDKGYNVISLDHFRSFLKGEGEVPSNAVLITFDDGYESFYQYAYPLLKEREMSAAMFMIVKHIGAREGQVPKLDWPQMQEMIGNGMYFHSHTYDSHFYHEVDEKGNKDAVLAARVYLPEEKRNETEEEYKARIYEDLKKSKDLLEQGLGVHVDFFSAPYGKKNQKVDEISMDIGLEYIFTIEPGLVSAASAPTALPRINAGSPDIDGDKLHQLIRKYAKHTP